LAQGLSIKAVPTDFPIFVTTSSFSN